MFTELIYCNNCKKETICKLIYSKIYKSYYYQCDCKAVTKAHVTGTGTNRRFRPMGTIPTNNIAKMRVEIHNKLDAKWKPSGRHRVNGRRDRIYKYLSKSIGEEYHTGSYICNRNGDVEQRYDRILKLLEEY